MNDEKFRLALHAAADECLSGVAGMPSQRGAVFERIEGKNRAFRRKTALVPVLAIMLTLAIVGATAAGLGLFGRLRESKVDEVSYERLGLLEEAAVTIGQTTAIGDHGELTIDQAYCDGSRLYYSYTIRKNDALASLYLGDGAKLVDGTKLPPVDSWIESVDDFETAAFYEVALPEGFTTGESVAILLTAMHRRDDGSFELIGVPVDIPVTAPRMTLMGEGTADGCGAKAELCVTDVDVYGTVRITAPEDYAPEGYALEVDGAIYPNLDWGMEYDGGTHVIALRFDLPENLDGARLVPVDPEVAHEAIELK